jgi:hypothetical protein
MDVLRRSLVGVTVAGLAIDAVVHLKLAGDYDRVGSTVSEGALFRMEAVMAIIAAILLMVRPGRLTAAFAALVAGGGTALLVLYYFVNIGALGPLPNMYEHVWFAEKVLTLVAQAVATVSAIALIVLGWPRASSTGSTVLIEDGSAAR